ncbi:uncharacterized protein DUF4435 [Ancylobacter aquaticus]|uniref:Uncharacterized protein DUF4435 n=1 Tax=Ancylobacter aquaticus TaxID=100 RepID=A0A4R1I3T6_ANCAQ|nr:DUF4435 domain-containing protein [Ancylobacter aquaticus]TCK28010.1 uncharacterized protein DUF4435 [Ancylobacter aquaticus]
MSFRRSDAGISNYKHFLGVDYVVYVEGKSDLTYWKGAFSRYRPELRLRYEKKDGVENLREIVEGVMEGRVSNVLVCRDSDYVPLTGGFPSNKRILRTHGYSFENDFFTPGAAAAIALLIAPEPIDEKLVQRAFRRYVNRLSSVGEWLLRLDVCFSATGQGLILRTNPRDLLIGDDVRGYEFSEARARARVDQISQRGRPAEIDFSPHGSIYPRYFCGHSVLFVLLHWCRVIVRRRAGRPLPASNSVIKNHLFSHYERLVYRSTHDFMATQLAGV